MTKKQNYFKNKFSKSKTKIQTGIKNLNKQGWAGWLKFSGLVALGLFISTLVFLALFFALHSIKGRTWDEWYEGDDASYWWYQINPKMVDVHGNKPIGYSDLDQGWLALALTGVVIAIVAIVFLGSWLAGANWINKTNPRKKGVPYVRTHAQNVIFRTITLSFGILLLTAFWIEVFADVIHKNMSARSVISNTYAYFTGLKSETNYSGGVSNWYFQCFVSAFIIGNALVFKKYNWMPVLLPMAFIGSVRTFIDPKGDWGEDGSWHSVYFHRFMVLHISITILPIFVMVANRQHYTFNKIFTTLLYTFMISFIPYIANAIAGTKSNGIGTDANGWGEMGGIASVLGLEDAKGHTGGDYVRYHMHHFFWLTFVPFGLALTTLVILISETFYYAFSKERKENWRRNIAIFKYGKWALRAKHFGGEEKFKTTRVAYGFAPKKLDSKSKYIIENGIAYKVNKEDAKLANHK